jgi:hypothetical protein
VSPLELTPGERLVEFIQYDIPPLKSGKYTLSATQTVNQPAPHDKFEASRQFAVVGERFSIDPSEIESVFPPPLATGEFADSLPHVAFSRRTLPWERTSVAADITAPWLAVLLFDEGEAPELEESTAADLFPEGEEIKVEGSKTTGKGKLPKGCVSYPKINPLDYGESPEEACTTIDVPREAFDKAAPSAEDLPFLAHIREADTVDAHDHPEPTATTAIVLGNRAGTPGTVSHAYLVSLENMGPLLPGAGGTPSKATEAKCVRLLVYRHWTFTATKGGETLQGLLENLNQPPPDVEAKPLSTLQVPFKGTRPKQPEVEEALKAQEAGKLTPAQSQVLVHDALGLGYVPLPHHLRHGGETVSWYRSPLAPLAAKTSVSTPISCPDAVNRYNPQTGMFDVSYGAAWQLGQLLALQNNAYAVALYQWRRELKVEEAAQAEQERIAELLDGAFTSVVQARERVLASSSEDEFPPLVEEWLARLRLLYGVPFNYLVPNEAMLPPESIRFFQLDRAWMEALVDGALSIGRVTSGERELDARRVTQAHDRALEAGRLLRGNAAPVTDYVNDSGEITGFLLRSQAVAGWPKLNAKGYADAKGNTEVKKLRLTRLSEDAMLCLFDGAIEMAALREPPEQLHCGFEGVTGDLTTTLREVQGETPGRQYLEDPKGGEPVAVVQARADGRTIEAAATAENIKNKLNTDFEQGLTKFTSAEFALEMVKGVVEVEFVRS